MSFIATAQELVVIDPSSINDGDFGHSMSTKDEEKIPIVPLEVSCPIDHDESPLEVGEKNVEIILSDLPGAPSGTPDPKEETLEVVDQNDAITEEDESSKKSKKNQKWDWESRGPTGFVMWIKEMADSIPEHSGYDSAGVERAISYMEKLDDEISKAMRLDLDGQLDANKIEEVRSKIDQGLSQLHDRLHKLKKTTKGKRKKKAESLEDGSLVKEGQKITGVQGVFVTVPLLISGIGRVCVNSVVSAGHDLEQVYQEQVDKWKLNDREKAEVRWFLYDLGYPMRGDRGYMPDETVDTTSSDNFDWAANYKG